MKHHFSEAFPSAPTRLAKYVIRFDSPRGLAIHGFCWPQAARALIELVVGDLSYKWTSDFCIHCPDLDLNISSHFLEDVMESTQEFDLPSPYPGFAKQIRGETAAPKAPEPQPQKPDEPKKPKLQKPSGLTTIADISATLSMEPREIRALLRKAKIEKPEHGWAWADPSPIYALLRK